MTIEMRPEPKIDPAHMLDNAATASQCREILDSPSTRGAILRSFAQWLNHNVVDAGPIMDRLKEDLDYDN